MAVFSTLGLARTIQCIAGGFLLAVLWFDLKFDLLAFEHMMGGAELEVGQLALIKTYYLQVLAMERGGLPLIMPMMFLAIIATVFESARGGGLSLWRRIAAPLLLIPPIALAGLRVVPNAGELAASVSPQAEQAALAVSILRDHLYCFTSIALFLLLLLAGSRGLRQD